MDEYDTAVNLLIDVIPLTYSTQNHNFRTTTSNVCSPEGSSCLSGNHCCQGGCSTSGTCICQAQNDWCFNYGGPDSFCCSSLCGVNGRCKCIPRGKSCAVGGEYCCNGLVCDDHSLMCTEQASQPSDKPNEIPTLAPTSKMPTGRPTPIEPNGRPAVACINVSVQIKTDRFGSGRFVKKSSFCLRACYDPNIFYSRRRHFLAACRTQWKADCEGIKRNLWSACI